MPNYLGATITLYANSDANLVREWIYSTTTINSYYRTMTVQTTGVNGGAYCSPAYWYTPTTYGAYTGGNLNVDIINFGVTSTTTLNIKLMITNVGGAFAMISSGYNSYPWFRFYIEGYDYTCFGVNKMDITYITAGGTRNTKSMAGWVGTTCSGNYFDSQFYVSGVGGVEISSGNWAGLTSFAAPAKFEVDVQLSISATEMPYLRDWIGVRAFINTYYWDMTCSCCWCCACCDYHYCYTYLPGTADQGHSSVPLANSLVLSSLTNNVGMPT